MKLICYYVLSSAFVLAFSACTTGSPVRVSPEVTDQNNRVVFKDAMTGDWRENWFLDGENATVRTSEDGLFFSGGTVTKPMDREEYHAHHAVLWTRQVFEGDLKITFEMTREDDSNYGNTLLYLYAQGVGGAEFSEDISEWSEFRAVPAMSKYFTYMDLLSISFRHNLRARRYPLKPATSGQEPVGGTVRPYVDYIGMIPGKTYQVEVLKQGPDLTLRLLDNETGETYVEYTWDMTRLGNDKKAPVLTKGRIGLRHMSTKKFTYKNFLVEKL